MTENEEFEFRARAEREKGGVAPASSTSPSDGGVKGLAQNVFGAVPEAAAALGTGMVAQPVSGYAGALGAALPGPPGQGAEWQRKTEQALTFRPRTMLGRGLTSVASMPGELISKGAGKAGELVTDVTGSPLAGAATKGALVAGPAAFGLKKLGAPEIPRELTPAQQRVASARDIGFKMTPKEMGAGVIPRALSGVAGEASIARIMSEANAKKATNLIEKDLELGEGVPLSRDATEAIRDQWGKTYEAIRKAGTISLDQELSSSLEKIVGEERQLSGTLEHRGESKIVKTADSIIKNKSLDANTVVNEIKALRRDANKSFAEKDGYAGYAYRNMAAALEEQLDRHLSKIETSGDMSGVPAIDPSAMAQFKKGRAMIAKSYAADRAMNPVTGEINPRAYAAMLQKGEKLSGSAADVAKFASEFERSSQRAGHKMGVEPSAMEALGSGAAIMKGKVPWWELLLRPAVRGTIATDAAQWAMDPRTNLSSPALKAAGASAAIPPSPQKETR